jgi:serine/threonine protein kinase/ankyrin repeat protein
MSHPHLCPECQQPLAPDAPDGLCPQCLLKAAAGPAPSSQLDGLAVDIIDIADPAEVGKRLPQFEIHELIGRGGMGVVYRARQQQLDRVVALKILPQVDALSPDFVARFTREARSLAKLNHPNIVHVYDFGETNGLYYIIMEFVDGKNLRELFEARKLTASQALAIVPRICDALQYAHEEGIVHRDIKPENILIDKRGSVKIADFGLAKLLRREPLDLTLTLSGMSLGTLRYMAPEQMDKPETVDHRADLYSLGVVIYEMLTGELPVGRFELPSQKAHVDARLDEIVLHALEREPARRYQHASEVRQDVEKVSGTSPEPAPMPAEPAAAVADGPVSPQTDIAIATPTPVSPKPRKRHLLQATLTLAWIITFLFGVNFQWASGKVDGVRTHFVTIGSFDPLFVFERHAGGFHNSINLFSWSFFAVVVSGFILSALLRIDREDGSKVQRDPEWWRGWWKHAGFWCGLLLLTCAIRTAINPGAVSKGRTPSRDLGIPGSPAAATEVQSAFFAAVAAGNVSEVRKLVRKGTSVNDKNAEGTPPLMIAAKHGHTAMVCSLILLGADVNERDAQGRTTLMIAAEHNQAGVIKAITDFGNALGVVWRETRPRDSNDPFTPKSPPGKEPTPKSTREVMGEYLSMVDAGLLDEIGSRIPQFVVDRNAQDRDGETALIKAAARGDIEAVNALSPWSEPKLQDRKGRTAAMHIALSGHRQLAQSLLEASVTFTASSFLLSPEVLAVTDHAGKTAIQIAEENGHGVLAQMFSTRMEQNIEYLNRAIADDANMPDLRRNLTARGWAHRALGHTEDADKDFARAAKEK